MRNNLPRISRFLSVFLIALLLSLSTTFSINAQSELESNNYKILDPSTDSGGGAGNSTNYSALFSAGNPTSDSRMESTSYALGSGFPNGIQANVPLIRCAETDSNSGTTNCTEFPNANGALGECGQPGCYDRMKVEIDHQSNPYDTLYLVEFVNVATLVPFYLQSNHTLDTTYDIADYMTICQIHGVDSRDTTCDAPGDPNYVAAYLSTNVFGVQANTTFDVRVRALSGDFTETQYSIAEQATTAIPSLVMDIDIGTTSAANTNAPYSVAIGELSAGGATTATNQIWLDLGTNAANGMNTYVNDISGALVSGANTIPSESEDLATDPNTNGGYGLKNSSDTEVALGPLQAHANYNTGGADIVGSLTLAPKLIYTTTETGITRGPLDGGRAGMYVKARKATGTVPGTYVDTVTFTMVGNW